MGKRSRSLTRWLVLAGAAAGFVIYACDYDFFLNAGGPETPISDALSPLHVEYRENWLVIVLWPAAVLMAIGATLGLSLSWVLGRLRAPRSPQLR